MYKLEILIEGQIIDLYTRAVDRYGRLVADVYLDGKNVTQLL